MKNFIREINKNKSKILLMIFIAGYIVYFSYFTILRYRTLYASYFDLGIMHQTVYNTYRAIQHADWSRFLELTNPYGPGQIKRMAIHNDILLALIAPFYFIYSGPETLLVIQTIVLALGGVAIFLLVRKIILDKSTQGILPLIFVIAYLLYSPMQRANAFEFHAVTLATTFLLFMYYFWLVKKYWLSLLFFLLSILSKEQVALTTTFFGLYVLYDTVRENKTKVLLKNSSFRFGLLIIGISITWFVASMLVIIPYFRGGNHFALNYYADFGDSPLRVIIGILQNPANIAKYIFHIDTGRYFFFLFGPLGFLSLLSPLHLLIALPEFCINLLSNNWNMRNVIYHYTSVIQPFVFIAGIYGVKKILEGKLKVKSYRLKVKVLHIILYILVFTLAFSYFKSPLPYSQEKEIHPFVYPQKEAKEAVFWKNILNNKKLKVSSTGQLAPFFSSRRYFYIFSKNYQLADYIVLRLNEIYNYPEKEQLIPIYERLKQNQKFRLIYKNENLEVYKKK